MEGSSKRICVTFKNRTKLVSFDSDKLSFEHVVEKIRERFSIVGLIHIRVKLNDFDNLIDVDENDEIAVLTEAKEILISSESNMDPPDPPMRHSCSAIGTPPSSGCLSAASPGESPSTTAINKGRVSYLSANHLYCCWLIFRHSF